MNLYLWTMKMMWLLSNCEDNRCYECEMETPIIIMATPPQVLEVKFYVTNYFYRL